MEIRTIELNSPTCHKQQTFDVPIHILMELEGDFVGRIPLPRVVVIDADSRIN
jgi:hypothetical protein